MVADKQFVSAHDAYYAVLDELVRLNYWTGSVVDPTSVGSGFGKELRRTKELIGSRFSITNPRNRWIFSGLRRANFGFAVANAIWTLSGTNDLSGIAAYNPRAASFATSDGILKGAVGHRLRSLESGDQIESLINLLRKDPFTRRAVAQTYLPQDLVKPILDVPCSIGFQFLARHSRLTALTYMRSQSALMLLPYDLFLFLLLHEAIAVSLGVDLGDYHHYCGSIHYYEDEEDLAKSVAGSNHHETPQAMPVMRVSPFERGFPLFEAEKKVRESLAEDPDAQIALAGYGLDEYWLQLLRVVVVYLKRQLGSLSWKEEYVELPETYRLWLEYGES
jgi:thymidylate synthase